METEDPRPNSDPSDKQRQRNKLLTTWMRLLAETTRTRENEELTPEKIKAYALSLSDLEPEALELGLRRASWECVWFPTVAEIRKLSKNPELAAEQAWSLVETIRRKFWHPDIGFLPACPTIDAATEYALRQIGGYHRINEATNENLDFIRKGFLQAFLRFHEEGGAQLRLSEGESRKALDTLKQLRAAEQKALPASTTEQRERNDFTRQKGYREMTENEWQSRVDELKQQAKRLQESL